MFGSDEKTEVQTAEVQTIEEPGTPENSSAPVDSSAEAIAKLQAERAALLDRVARTQAEFDNYRKRSAREQADFREYAVADAAKALLPVADSFDLALRAPATEGDAELRKGVELIRKQLEEALAKIGVKPVPAVGEEFDPRVHEALEMVETPDAEDNHVIAELQRGYKIKDRLLRPAMVRVARNHK
jgi:molecular chaperone GrpE